MHQSCLLSKPTIKYVGNHAMQKRTNEDSGPRNMSPLVPATISLTIFLANSSGVLHPWPSFPAARSAISCFAVAYRDPLGRPLNGGVANILVVTEAATTVSTVTPKGLSSRRNTSLMV